MKPESEHVNLNAQLEAELLEDLLISREFVRALNPEGNPHFTSPLYMYHLKRVEYLLELLNPNPKS